MRKTLLTALVISASVCTAFAQDQKTDASANVAVVKEADQKSNQVKQAQDWQNLLVTELKLTDEQVKKITELNKAFGDRRVAIEKNTDLSDEAKAERKTALLKAKEAQFTQLLTAEQQTKYKELVEAKTKEKKDN
jgi:hypothetical protein